jgi:hypothetical protein
VRPLSCARLSIGKVLEFLCWKWKPYPRVVLRNPDWFEYCFIYEKFVACREFWLSSQYQNCESYFIVYEYRATLTAWLPCSWFWRQRIYILTKHVRLIRDYTAFHSKKVTLLVVTAMRTSNKKDGLETVGSFIQGVLRISNFFQIIDHLVLRKCPLIRVCVWCMGIWLVTILAFNITGHAWFLQRSEM